jgi:integrase
MFTRRLRRPPESAPYHAKRVDERPVPRYRPVLATLTLAGLRVSELCALNCEHVDLGRRELRVLDAKTPAGVRQVDIHDDLQEELAAYKAARRDTWRPGQPAFLNARGKRWTRNAIAQHVIPPSLEEANRQRDIAGSRRSAMRSRRTRCATRVSLRFSPPAQIRNTSPPRSGTKT